MESFWFVIGMLGILCFLLTGFGTFIGSRISEKERIDVTVENTKLISELKALKSVSIYLRFAGIVEELKFKNSIIEKLTGEKALLEENLIRERELKKEEQ